MDNLMSEQEARDILDNHNKWVGLIKEANEELNPAYRDMAETQDRQLLRMARTIVTLYERDRNGQGNTETGT